MNIDYSRDLRILVVDDVQVHRFLMSSGIERVNPFVHVEQASGLEEAIARLNDQHFDAVVCDWKMAGGDGNSLVKWMRARANYRRVPFIMISGNADNEDIIRAFMEFGVDAYVVKPFSAKDLYDKIMAALHKRKST
ncbi:MAG TPA: response regulator [Noviherbaspirillum sp.]|uniref:response regulator n=1 Tax=Noviherbaspirillum sp. TaxID=1926288 RepID=UPI002B4A8D96|nr:response regulator [Noviherbaspirillum sp.]HJV88214.1 response regulator [Noviherbaspirillum sp.]